MQQHRLSSLAVPLSRRAAAVITTVLLLLMVMPKVKSESKQMASDDYEERWRRGRSDDNCRYDETGTP